jgi:hypothetical protein
VPVRDHHGAIHRVGDPGASLLEDLHDALDEGGPPRDRRWKRGPTLLAASRGAF